MKHKMADMYVKIELARSNAYYGAWALSTDSNELPVAAAGARVSASDAYNYASKENVQIHGLSNLLQQVKWLNPPHPIPPYPNVGLRPASLHPPHPI